jgi:serine/threonine protein kinase
MLDPQVSRFWQATLLSGLMDAQGLTACWEAIAPAKREVPEHLDRRLARQAVQLKSLTLWQAQQLLAGRTSGFKVDRYVLLDLIGQGGMGRVYLARDSRLNRQVALKILSPERISNPRAIARFQREARVGAQLQHENLVRIYDFGESNGRFYLVMEYIEGKTIGTFISEQGQIPPDEAVRLVRQVALGLEHAHRKGLIHRDVNPYNILVTRDGTAKLADLGLAIDLAEDDHVTREGATVGTFDYVAPEQARHSHSADIRSDIYSLGCTIYHMCAGQVPFPGPSLPEKLFAHQALEPTPLDQLVPGLPDGLGEVVNRMMRKSPDERFATPMQVIQALDRYLDDSSITKNREVPTVPGQESAAEPLGSPQSAYGEVLSVKSQQRGGAAAPALRKTVAVLDGSEAPAQSTPETGSTPSAELVAAPLQSPPCDDDVSDQVSLFLDLGPEPSLGEGLSRSKPRSAVDPPESAIKAGTPAGRSNAFWLWGLVGLTTTVMVLVGLAALVKSFDFSPAKIAAGSLSSRDAKAKSKKAKTDAPETITKARPAIVVRSEGEDDQEFPSQKLYEAMQTAIGARGWVELQNQEPLHLKGDQALNFSSGRGRLIVRAAVGIQPVIEIELTGPNPLLTTGSGVVLELAGVTFRAHYPSQVPSANPPALIAAAGSAKIERCAFQVTGATRPKGSRAVISNGGVLEVNRCWFQGFDQAIDVTAMNRTPAQIRQTMFVAAFEPAQAQDKVPDWYGWGVKLQVSSGGGPTTDAPQPRLILERCTVEEAGLIDLTDSPGSSLVEVEVNYCAVKARAILACKHSIPPSSQIRWRGKGNQYDILGPTWIVLSASEGTPAFSVAATDLQGWSLFAPGDRDLIQDTLKFQSDFAVRTTLAKPSAYRIEGRIAPQLRPGADPELVGPWGAP